MNPNRHLKKKKEQDEESFERQKYATLAKFELIPEVPKVGRKRFEEELEDEIVRKKKKKRNMGDDRDYGY